MLSFSMHGSIFYCAKTGSENSGGNCQHDLLNKNISTMVALVTTVNPWLSAHVQSELSMIQSTEGPFNTNF